MQYALELYWVGYGKVELAKHLLYLLELRLDQFEIIVMFHGIPWIRMEITYSGRVYGVQK